MESAPVAGPSCGKGSDDGKDDEYDKKFKELQKYVPFLKGMIRKLELSSDKVRDAQLSKMKNLYNILSNPKRRLKIDTLDRCEEVLNKLEEKLKTQFGASIPLPDSPGPLKKHRAESDEVMESPASPPQLDEVSSQSIPKLIPVERCTTVERDFSRGDEELSLESSRERLKGVMISQSGELNVVKVCPEPQIAIPGLDMVFPTSLPTGCEKNRHDERISSDNDTRWMDSSTLMSRRVADVKHSSRDSWLTGNNEGERQVVDSVYLSEESHSAVDRRDPGLRREVSERLTEGRLSGQVETSRDMLRHSSSLGPSVPSRTTVAPVVLPVPPPPTLVSPVHLQDIWGSRGTNVWYADSHHPTTPSHSSSNTGFHHDDVDRRGIVARSVIREKLGQEIDKIEKLGVSKGGALRTLISDTRPLNREEVIERERIRGSESDKIFHEAPNSQLTEQLGSTSRNHNAHIERDPRRTLLPTPLIGPRGARPDPRPPRDSAGDILPFNRSLSSYPSHTQTNAGQGHQPHMPYGNPYGSKSSPQDLWIPPSRTTVYHHGNSGVVQMHGASGLVKNTYQWQTTCTTVKQTTAHDLGYRYQPRSRHSMPLPVLQDREGLSNSSIPVRQDDGHLGGRDFTRCDENQRKEVDLISSSSVGVRKYSENKTWRKSSDSRIVCSKTRSDEKRDCPEIKSSSVRKKDSEDASSPSSASNNRLGAQKTVTGSSMQNFRIPKVRRETISPPPEEPTPPPPPFILRPSDPRLTSRDPRVLRARSRPPSPQLSVSSSGRGCSRSPSPSFLQGSSLPELQPMSPEPHTSRYRTCSPSPPSHSHSQSRAKSPSPSRSRSRASSPHPRRSKSRSRFSSPISSRSQSKASRPSRSRERTRSPSQPLTKASTSTLTESQLSSKAKSPTPPRMKPRSSDRVRSMSRTKSPTRHSPNRSRRADSLSEVDQTDRSCAVSPSVESELDPENINRGSRGRSRSRSRVVSRRRSRSTVRNRSHSRSCSRGRSQCSEGSRGSSHRCSRSTSVESSRSCRRARSRGRSRGRSRERSVSRGRSHSRGRSTSRRRSRSRERATSRRRSRSRRRSLSRGRSRSRAQSTRRSREPSREISVERSRDPSRERLRERSRGRSRDRSRERSRDRYRDHSRERDGSRFRYRSASRNRHDKSRTNAVSLSPSAASSRSSSCSLRITPSRDSSTSSTKDISHPAETAKSHTKKDGTTLIKRALDKIRSDLHMQVESTTQLGNGKDMKKITEHLRDVPSSTSESLIDSVGQRSEVVSSSERPESALGGGKETLPPPLLEPHISAKSAAENVPSLGNSTGEGESFIMQLLRKCLDEEAGKKLLLEIAAKTLPSEKQALVLNIFNETSRTNVHIGGKEVEGGEGPSVLPMNKSSGNVLVDENSDGAPVHHIDDMKPAKEPRKKKQFKAKKTSTSTVADETVLDSHQSSSNADISPECGEKHSKRRNELEKLHQDIKEMFICNDVVHATGQRSCRLRRESKEIVASTPKSRPSSADEKLRGRQRLKEYLESSEESFQKQGDFSEQLNSNQVSCINTSSEPDTSAASTSKEEENQSTKKTDSVPKENNVSAVQIIISSDSEDDIPISEWKKQSESTSDEALSPVCSKKKRKTNVIESESDSDVGSHESNHAGKSIVPCVLLEKINPTDMPTIPVPGSRNTARRGRKFGMRGRDMKKAKLRQDYLNSESEEVEDKDMSQIDSSNIIQVEDTGSKLTRRQLKKLQGFDIGGENTSPSRHTGKTVPTPGKQEVSGSPKTSVCSFKSCSDYGHGENQNAKSSVNLSEKQLTMFESQEFSESHLGHVFKSRKKWKRASSWQRGIIEKKPHKSSKTEKIGNEPLPENSREDCASQRKTEEMPFDVGIDAGLTTPEVPSSSQSLSSMGDVKSSVKYENFIDLNYVITDGKMYYCKLCSFMGKTIVGHYKSSHSESEVLISRLPLHLAEQMRLEPCNVLKEDLACTKEVGLVFKCLLCKNASKSTVGLFEHISTHTGEYRYECVLCGFCGPYKKTMHGHYQKSHNSESSPGKKKSRLSYKAVIPEPQCMDILFGYMCSECNFFQLQEANIVKHLEAAHSGSASGHCIRIKPYQPVLEEDMKICTQGEGGTTNFGSQSIQETSVKVNHLNCESCDKGHSREKNSASSESIIPKSPCTLHSDAEDQSSMLEEKHLQDIPSSNQHGEASDLNFRSSCDTIQSSARELPSPMDITITSSEPPSPRRELRNSKPEVAYCDSILRRTPDNLSAECTSAVETDPLELAASLSEQSRTSTAVSTCVAKKPISGLEIAPTGLSTNASVKSAIVTESETPTILQEIDSHETQPSFIPQSSVLPDHGLNASKEKCRDSSSVDLSIFVTSVPVDSTEKHIEKEREKLLKDAGEKIKSRPVKNRTSVLDLLTERIQLKTTEVGNDAVQNMTLPANKMQETDVSIAPLSGFIAKTNLRVTPSRLAQKCSSAVPVDSGERRLTRSISRPLSSNSSNVDPLQNLPEAVKLPLPASELNDTLQRMRECLESPIISKWGSSSSPLSTVSTSLNLLSADSTSNNHLTPVSAPSTHHSVGAVISVGHQMKDKIHPVVRVGGIEAREGSEGVIFICHVESCLFTSTMADLYLNHAKEKHAHWKHVPHCSVCGSMNSVNSLQACLTHLQEKHILTIFQGTQNKHRVPSIIRPRRLPGDTLSEHIPRPVLEVDSEGAPEVDNELPSLIISSVVSLSKHHTPEGMPLSGAKASPKSIQESPPVPPPMPPAVPLQLDRFRRGSMRSPASSSPVNQPALSADASLVPVPGSNKGESLVSECPRGVFITGMKDEESMKRMLRTEKLRHLFKCKGYCCTFSTNLKTKFAEHYQKHLLQELKRNANAASESYEWQKCVYCGDSKDSGEDLVDHILTLHSMSKYQCSYCFYRAACQSNVVFHQNLCHTNDRIQVLECRKWQPTKKPPSHSSLNREYIQVYRCAQGDSCLMEFMTKENLYQHIIKEHVSENQFVCCHCRDSFSDIQLLVSHYESLHGYTKFYCLHCPIGTRTKQEIAYHVSLMHPTEDPLVAARMPCPETVVETIVISRNLALPVVPCMESEGSDPVLLINLPRGPIESEETDQTTDVDRFDSDGEKMCYIVTQVPGLMCQLVFNSPACTTPQSAVRPSSISNELENSGNKMDVDEDQNDFNNDSKEMETEISDEVTGCDLTISQDGVNEQTKESSFESGKCLDEVTVPRKDLERVGLTGSDLYRCGNSGCTFSAENSNLLKEHLLVCDLARDSHILSCAHCERPFKYPVHLIDHLQTHGLPRFGCSLCDFRSTSSPVVIRHVKQKHRVTNTEVVPLHPLHRDPETALFSVRPKDLLIRRGKTKTQLSATAKTMFGPEEIPMLPLPAVFTRNVNCALCNYTTKVRSNMVRHLEQHASGREASPTPVVNPVPCLERSEKMFDTMTNHAVSSNMPVRRDSNATKTLDEPKFIPENKRYVCCAASCLYVTSDDAMLRHHIRVLHTDVLVYKCPHCSDTDPETLKHPILLEKVGSHLKMHGSRLYSCLYCTYHHYKRHHVERHTVEKHWDQKRIIRIVREPKGGDLSDVENAVGMESEFMSLPAEAPSMWECGICTLKGSRVEVVNHVATEHRIHAQFKCALCNFRANNRSRFSGHFTNKHSNDKEEVIAVFRKVEKSLSGPSTPVMEIPSTAAEDVPFDSTPLWQRDAHRLRHLRGILFEENGPNPREMERSEMDCIRSVGIKRSSIDVDDDSQCRKRDKLDPRSEFLMTKFGSFVVPFSEACFYRCPKCSIQFSSSNMAEFREHLCKEINYRRFKCTLCPATSSSRFYLRKHITKSHKDEMKNNVMVSICTDQDSEDWVNLVLEAQGRTLSKAGNSVQSEPPSFTSPSPAQANHTTNKSGLASPVRECTSPLKTLSPSVTEAAQTSVSVPQQSSKSVQLGSVSISPKASTSTGSGTTTPTSSPTKRLRGTSILKKLTPRQKYVVPETESSPSASNPPESQTGISSPSGSSAFIPKGDGAETTKQYKGKLTEPGAPSGTPTSHMPKMEAGVSQVPSSKPSIKPISPSAKKVHLLPPSTEAVPDESAFELDIEEIEIDEHCMDLGLSAESSRKYACSYCGQFVAKTVQDLKFHEMLHWETKPYKCSHCDFQNVRAHRVKKHFEKAHPDVKCTVEENVLPETPVIVPFIGRRKRLSASAVECLRLPDSENNYQGEQEDSSVALESPSVEILAPHDAASAIPDMVFANIKMYRCGYCRLQDASITRLLAHWQGNHRNSTSLAEDAPNGGKVVPFKYREVSLDRNERHRLAFRCGLCARTGTVKVLVEHYPARHPGQALQIRPLVHPRLQCTLCSRQFCNRTALDAHFRALHPGHVCTGIKVNLVDEEDNGQLSSSFECGYCLERVETEEEMRDHHLHFHSHLSARFTELSELGHQSQDQRNQDCKETQQDTGLVMQEQTDSEHVLNSDTKPQADVRSVVKKPVAKKSTSKFRLAELQGMGNEQQTVRESCEKRAVAKKSTSKFRNVARKSTGCRFNKPECKWRMETNLSNSEDNHNREGFSFYGCPQEPVDMKKISCPMMFGPTTTRVTVATWSQIADIFPVVEVVDLRTCKDIPDNIQWSWPHTASKPV